MADYVRFGTAVNLFNAYSGRPLDQMLVESSATEFSFRNKDGSFTIVTGSGFFWNATAGRFTAGTVTGIRHEADRDFIDGLEGLDVAAGELQSALESVIDRPLDLHVLLFGGDDLLDARVRAGGVVVPLTLWGMAGDDIILGGAGRDLLIGGSGSDTVAGGQGGDWLHGESGDDLLSGGGGGDKLYAGFGDDRVLGGGGNDTIHGGGGDDVIQGAGGRDTAIFHSAWHGLDITREGNVFTVSSYSGTDTLTGIEVIATDTGIYRWVAASQDWVRVSATPGEVLLAPFERQRGTNGNDTIDAVATGKTIIEARNGNDIVYGGGGFDLVLGGNGRDFIFGDVERTTSSIDRLYGEAGNDALWGYGGDDRLDGGSGADHLYGGNGYDALTGGAGADIFHFRFAGGEDWGHDVVSDFVVGVDRLDLDFGSEDLVPDVSQSPRGLLLTLEGAGSILLEGIHGAGATLHDLLI